MGLLTNGFRDAIGVYQFYGAGTVNGGYPSSLHGNFARTGRNRNKTAGQGITDETVGIPYGYRNPGAWVMPQKAGAMSMRMIAAGGLAADLLPSRNMTIDLTGAGDLEAVGALVVSMLLAMTGSGSLTASITGRLNMTADLTGTGDLAADMSGLGSMVIDLLGEGDLDATIAAFGDMAIDLTVTGTGLSTANVGAAVWQALSAANNDAGTMGNKLNSAASAGDPWGTALPGAYPAGSAGHIIGTYIDAAVSAGGLTVEQAAQLTAIAWRLRYPG